MKYVVVIIVALMLVPTVSAQPPNFPSSPQIGDTLTHIHTQNMTQDFKWSIGSIWIAMFFYPDIRDTLTVTGGEWIHKNTREIGVWFNMTACRSVAQHESPYLALAVPFNLDYLRFYFGRLSFTYKNVTEGKSFNTTGHFSVFEDGINIGFDLAEHNLSLEYRDLFVVFNVSVTFETTYFYYENYRDCGTERDYTDEIYEWIFRAFVVFGLLFFGMGILNEYMKWREKTWNQNCSKVKKKENQ